MSDRQPCYPNTLAAHGVIRVDLCGCGHVHVSIGPFTVRLAQAQYRTLCETLQRASRQLPQGPETLPRPLHERRQI